MRPATIPTMALLAAVTFQACTPTAAPSSVPSSAPTAGAGASTTAPDSPAATLPPATLPPATATAEPTATPAPLPSLAASTAGCDAGTVAAGERDVSVKIDGQDRSALLHVPPGLEPGVPVPLLLSFHGTFSDPADQAWISGFSEVADTKGFVVGYPAGVGDPTGWRVDEPGAPDDVAFVVALIDELGRQLCLDPRRVFLTGFSAGGIISQAVACRLDGRIGGIALVSTGHYVEQPGCLPAHPVPTIVFHGILDPLIPYRGGWIPIPEFEGMPPVMAIRDWMDGWAANNGCEGEPVEGEPVGWAVRLTWPGCDAPTVLVRLGDGGHAWPGGNGFEVFGRINRDVSASADSWAFFTD